MVHMQRHTQQVRDFGRHNETTKHVRSRDDFLASKSSKSKHFFLVIVSGLLRMVLVKGEVVVKLGWSECPVQTDETKWLGPSELLPIVARIPTKKRLLDGVFLGGGGWGCRDDHTEKV